LSIEIGFCVFLMIVCWVSSIIKTIFNMIEGLNTFNKWCIALPSFKRNY